jgi:hypothetical protein
MLGIPSPLGNVGFSESRRVGLSSQAWGSVRHEQYLGQWGEDWLRLVEQERLDARKSIFQEFAKQFITNWPETRVPVVAVEQQGESAEMDWLINHVHEVERHKGEWLVIHGGELVGHSRDFSQIRALVSGRGIRSPFVYYVPTDEESNSVSI